MTNCSLGQIDDSTLECKIISSSYYVGGIAGEASGNIENCKVACGNANVTIQASNYAGGLVGLFIGDINNCQIATSGNGKLSIVAVYTNGAYAAGCVVGIYRDSSLDINSTVIGIEGNAIKVTLSARHTGAVIGWHDCTSTHDNTDLPSITNYTQYENYIGECLDK